MSTRFKFNEKTLSTVLYVGAAIMIVAIICVSVFAFVNNNRRKTVPVETTATPPVTTFTPETAPGTTEERPTINPVTEDNSGAVGVNNPVTSKPVTYVNPVEGEVIKSHNTETLVYSLTMNDYRAHCGVDIKASIGTPVYAAAAGKITKIYTDYMMGTCLEIDHGNGVKTCYKNLGETLPSGITEGVNVTSGQVIAGVGESAISEIADEAHLHIEVLKDGKQVNPLDYLSYGKEEDSE